MAHLPTSLARAEWGTPVVSSATERDMLFPNPLVHQRVQNLQTQCIERWSGIAWIADISYPAAGITDATPVVATTAARDAMFPSPVTNQRVQNLQTQAVERYTGTAWVADITYPGIPVSDSTPVVADQAARDAKFPTPSANQRVQRADTGFVERYSGSAWLQESVTRAAGPVVGARAKGAIGNGTADDRAALAAMDAAVATSGTSELDPGTYRVNTNLTLSGAIRIPRGAMIRPASGVTVTVLGDVDAGAYKWMDFSLGGAFSFAGNRNLRRYLPQWFGIVGTATGGGGDIDDAPAWQNMLNTLPPRACVEFPHQMVMRWNSTVTWVNGFGVRLVSNLNPFDTTTDASDTGPKIIWGGAANGTMLVMNGCGLCSFIGFNFQCTLTWGATGGANICIDLQQQSPASRISTQNYFRYCAFWTGSRNANAVLVQNSVPASNNNEYHYFDECLFRGTSQSIASL